MGSNSPPVPKQQRRSKDRDGLYKRRDYWHYELTIDGKKRSFTTRTKDYNEAKKKRAAAIQGLEECRAPDDSGRKRREPTAKDYIHHREATVAAGTVRIEKERLVTRNHRRTVRDYQGAGPSK